ncbi:GNAT family N-acetyltransferase [Paenibacillus sp. FSL H7-689]|uniref:GNAT family N-acetyltransferase n=1 Tax=Paenibacillus sp. FSL H7-689 TaxID=1227349 RepID=UPI0003E1D005|nr:N-acetyltransferase [Paenibacillus sp. FSL H7-689]ETT41898.1 N-acetyltransferase GCN5 [Paenibacillus sp. FSL H7-689]
MKQLPVEWKSDRLIVSNVEESDIPELESIYETSRYLHQWDGQELIQALTRHFSELGYKEIRINVALKNWPALRFWIKSGFNQISRIYGDLQHSEDTFANTELIKSL